MSFSRNNKKMYPLTQIGLRQIERYVFLRISWYEKTRLIHVLCASSQLWGSHGGAVQSIRTTRETGSQISLFPCTYALIY